LNELTQLVDDINAAVVKADMTYLERVLHKDYVHHGQHGMIENRSQYLENRQTGRVDYESLVANDVKVRVYGDTAIVTYLSTAKGKDPLGAIDDQRLFTGVFIRQDGPWQQVHSQATPIRLPAARPAEEGERANSHDPADDEPELAQLVKDLNRAIVDRDIDFLDRILHQDYLHFRPRGIAENRAQYVENRQTGRVDYESLIADDIKARVYGNTAVVTYRSTANGKDQQGAIDGQRLWTRVFVRGEGRWQLVHSQGTSIQRP
jgi:ketosteroid isomerase-like protein